MVEQSFTCKTCGQIKQEQDFYRVHGKPSPNCKKCVIARSKKYTEITMQKCESCGEIKPIKLFPLRKKKPFKRMHQCCSCHKAKRSRVRVRTPETTETRKNRVLVKKKFILMYFKDHPCVDCGEKNPVVLDFDHRERKDKEYTVSVLLGMSFSMQKLVAEIEKCDVRCANCHRKRTAKQLQWDWLKLLDSDLSACPAPE